MDAFADLGKHQGIAEIQQEGARGKFIDRFRNNARGEQVRKVKPEPSLGRQSSSTSYCLRSASLFRTKGPGSLAFTPGTLHNATSRRVFSSQRIDHGANERGY